MNDTTFQGDGKVAYVPVVVDTKPKPVTNADRIRAMTDEELARWLTKTQRIGDVEVFRDGYYQLWLDWLQQPATE